MPSSEVSHLWEDDLGGLWAARGNGEEERAGLRLVQRQALTGADRRGESWTRRILYPVLRRLNHEIRLADFDGQLTH